MHFYLSIIFAYLNEFLHHSPFPPPPAQIFVLYTAPPSPCLCSFMYSIITIRCSTLFKLLMFCDFVLLLSVTYFFFGGIWRGGHLAGVYFLFYNIYSSLLPLPSPPPPAPKHHTFSFHWFSFLSLSVVDQHEFVFVHVLLSFFKSYA